VDICNRDIGGYVTDAKKGVEARVRFPPGYYMAWIGVVQTRVTLFPVSALLVGAAKKRVSKSLILAALL
jgi:Cu/Ag efflux pump CusA